MSYKRTDSNQQEIIDDMRQVGITVIDISMVGNGCPDILAGYRYQTELMEIKDGNKVPSKRKLTPKEKSLHHKWRGRPIRTVKSSAEALIIFGIN